MTSDFEKDAKEKTILNNASDGFPFCLDILASVVWQNQGITRKDLLEACSSNPNPSKEKEGKKDKELKDTLRSWTSLGLFNEKKSNGQITLSKILEDRLGAEDERASFSDILAVAMCECLFSKENKNLATDLKVGLAWLMLQNVYSPDQTGTPKDLDHLQSLQIKENAKKFIQNSNRLPLFREYAYKLGFVSFMASAKEREPWMIIDPSVAIGRRINEIFGTEPNISIKKFISKLANLYPVLDEGAYQDLAKERLKESSVLFPDNSDLSWALSFALTKLEKMNLLEFELKSDAVDNAYRIAQPSGSPRRVTDLKRKNRA